MALDVSVAFVELLAQLTLQIGSPAAPQFGAECLTNPGTCLANSVRYVILPFLQEILGMLNFIDELILYTPHPTPGLGAWYTGSGLDEPWQSLYDQTYSESVMLATLLLIVQLTIVFFLSNLSPFLGSYQKERLFRRWVLALIGVWGWVHLAGTALAFAHYFPQAIVQMGQPADPTIGTQLENLGEDAAMVVMMLAIAWVVGPSIILGVFAMYAVRNLLLIVYLYGMPIVIAFWPIDVGFMKPLSSKSKSWMQKFTPLLLMTIPNAFILKVADVIGDTSGSFSQILIGIPNVESQVGTLVFKLIDLMLQMTLPFLAIILPKYTTPVAGKAFGAGKKLNVSGTFETTGDDEEESTDESSSDTSSSSNSTGNNGYSGETESTSETSPTPNTNNRRRDTESGGSPDSVDDEEEREKKEPAGAEPEEEEPEEEPWDPNPDRVTDPDSRAGKVADRVGDVAKQVDRGRKAISYIAPNEVRMGKHQIASQNPDRFQRKLFNKAKSGSYKAGKAGAEKYNEAKAKWGARKKPDNVDARQADAAKRREAKRRRREEESSSGTPDFDDAEPEESDYRDSTPPEEWDWDTIDEQQVDPDEVDVDFDDPPEEFTGSDDDSNEVVESDTEEAGYDASNLFGNPDGSHTSEDDADDEADVEEN